MNKYIKDMTVQKMLETIDLSKMERDYVDISSMCEIEFGIYDYIEQPSDNIRLTYCYYHRWICTDTEVGIRVWYLDDVPVCISHQPYRKYNESYEWMSDDGRNRVYDYIKSLMDDDMQFDIVSDESIAKIVENYEKIEFKKFEEKNICT